MRPVWRLLRWFWRAVTRQPSKTLLDRIKEEEEILYGLTTTFGELRAFGEALTSRVGQSKFVIANVTIWEAMLARRDLLTIHFASWIRGLAEAGGFFAQLRAHHVRDLRKAWDEKFKPSGSLDKDAIHKMTNDRRRKRLEERFPAAVARGKIDPEDIEAFKDAIWKKLVPVVKDRDSFRAHPHDGEAKADARMLGLDELEPLLLEAQAMMNDMRVAADFSTFGYPTTKVTDPPTAAEDLVDLLLFHDVLGMAMRFGANELLHKHVNVYWWQLRDEFFAELRRAHATQPDLPINAPELLGAIEESMATKYKATS